VSSRRAWIFRRTPSEESGSGDSGTNNQEIDLFANASVYNCEEGDEPVEDANGYVADGGFVDDDDDEDDE
jgi:hypothetical protein